MASSGGPLVGGHSDLPAVQGELKTYSPQNINTKQFGAELLIIFPPYPPERHRFYFRFTDEESSLHRAVKEPANM